MNPPVLRAGRVSWLRLAGTGLALALLIYLLGSQGWGELAAAFRQIAPWRLALALVLMGVSRLAVAARWYKLLKSGGLPVSFRQTLRITFAGLFASNFLPTTVGGDLVRLAGVLQLHLDAAVGTASLIADRLVGMAGMAVMVPFALPVLWNQNTQTLTTTPWTSSLALPGWLGWAYRKTLELLRRLYQAMGLWLRQPGAVLVSLAFTGLHMACLFSVMYLLLDGMGQSLSIWTIGGLYSLVYFVTLIPISVNGYGLQEVSMTLIFSNLGRAPVSAGLTVALLFRTLMMVASLPGVFFVPDILAASRQAAGEGRF